MQKNRTVRLRMRQTQSGRCPGWTDSGTFHCRKNQEYDVPEGLAEAWLAANVAELASKVRPAPVVEATTVEVEAAEIEPEDEPEMSDE